MNPKDIYEMQIGNIIESTMNLLRSIHFLHEEYCSKLQGDTVTNAKDIGLKLSLLNQYGHGIMEEIEIMKQMKADISDYKAD